MDGRRPYKADDGGSIPSATIDDDENAPVGNLVKPLASEARDFAGSTPARGITREWRKLR